MLGLCQKAKFCPDPRNSDPQTLWTPSTEISCTNYQIKKPECTIVHTHSNLYNITGKGVAHHRVRWPSIVL